jgi:lipoprotein NlpI
MLFWYVAQQRSKAGGGGTELDAYIGDADLSKWPGPLLGYLQGSVSEEDVLKAAAADPDTATAHLCDAKFFLGEMDLLVGEIDEARKSFNDAVSSCPKTQIEYFGAKAELGRL